MLAMAIQLSTVFSNDFVTAVWCRHDVTEMELRQIMHPPMIPPTFMKNILLFTILGILLTTAFQSTNAATTPDQEKAIQVLREAMAKTSCPSCNHKGGNYQKTKRCDCPQCLICNGAAAPTTREGRLAALTRQYRAGKMAPRVYHEERIKILAE